MRVLGGGILPRLSNLHPRPCTLAHAPLQYRALIERVGGEDRGVLQGDGGLSGGDAVGLLFTAAEQPSPCTPACAP